MKKIILTLILFSIISSLYSQTRNPNYGYILLSNQDSVMGYFLNKTEFYNSKNIDFIIDANSNKIQSFESADIISGKSKKIEIVSVNVKSSVGYEKIIAEKLIIGKYASLYKSYKNGEELFYIEKDTSIIELSTKYFIGSINVLLDDCNRLKTDYSETKDPEYARYTYKESVFAQLVIAYNKCKGDASDVTVIKSSPFVNRVGAFIGTTSSKITFNKPPYQDVDFERYVTPSLGLTGSITFKEYITFESNLVYTLLKSTGKFTSQGSVMNSSGGTVTFVNVDIDAILDYKIHLVQIPLSLKLNLFKINNLQPFVKGGVSLDWAVANKSEAYSTNYNDQINYPTINYSTFWGLGVNKLNENNTLYFIEIDLCTSKSKSAPITSFAWVTTGIEGTFKYFTIRLGKTF